MSETKLGKNELQNSKIRASSALVRQTIEVEVTFNGENKKVSIDICACINLNFAIAKALGAKRYVYDECFTYVKDVIELSDTEQEKIITAIEQARREAVAELQEKANWDKSQSLAAWMNPAVLFDNIDQPPIRPTMMLYESPPEVVVQADDNSPGM